MIEVKINSISGKTSRSSLFLSRSFLESNRIERNLEKKSLTLKRKLVEERSRTLKAIASRNKETQKGGVLGGALGLLGLGGGGRLLRRGLRRTPRSPSQLLRMQKGTSNLSRVSRLGKLARPLAVVGTGLDFVGRRAEGQSNVQAGVGAAGGLAGSLAGAKAGAILGTAVGGPIGTVIGSAGGAIIGGLAGGRLADLFTGANRRRKFEEERVVLRTQKTLFSEALDDFDNVLDKFEDVSIGLAIGRRRDDDEEGGKRKRPRLPIVPPPKPTTPFLQRPAVKVIGTTALALGLTVLAVKFAPVIIAKGAILLPAFKKALATKGFTKLTIEKQLRVIAKEIGREKLIKRMSKAFDKNRGKIMKTKKEANKIRKGKILKRKEADRKFAKDFLNLTKGDKTFEVFDFLTKFNLKSPTKLKIEYNKAFSKIREKLLKLYRDGKITEEQFAKKSDMIQKDYLNDFARLDRYEDEIMQLFNAVKNIKPDSKSIDALLDGLMKDIRNLNNKFPKIKPNKTPAGNKISSSDIEIESNSNNIAQADIENQESFDTNLALAPMGNVFLLNGNNNNNQQPSTIINQSDNLAMSSNRSNRYDDVINNIRYGSALTA